MRNTLCSLAISGVLVFSGSALFGQADNSMQQQPPAQAGAMQGGGMGHGGRMMDPDQQLAHMTKALNLSADQQSQIKPILTDRQQQMMALYQDQSMSRPDKMAKMKSIHEDSDSKINAILNDQQKQKYAQMQAMQKQKMMEHRQEGGATGQPPANPPQ